MRNGPEIASYTQVLAARLGELFDAGRWPLVLGGDCSVLLGAMLALKRRGRYGLLFIDGHLDFRHPGNSSRVGAVAGEDLAVVTGRGLPEHTDIQGLGPYVRDEDVVAIGEREGDEQTADVLDTRIEVIDLERVRRLGGVEAAWTRARDIFEERGLAGFWIHLDIDVLDSDLMPAVDSPQPGGLGMEELERLLELATAAPLAVGAEVTIFDPELDPSGRLAERLASLLVDGVRRGAGARRRGRGPAPRAPERGT
jgi:arginase